MQKNTALSCNSYGLQDILVSFQSQIHGARLAGKRVADRKSLWLRQHIWLQYVERINKAIPRSRASYLPRLSRYIQRCLVLMYLNRPGHIIHIESIVIKST